LRSVIHKRAKLHISHLSAIVAHFDGDFNGIWRIAAQWLRRNQQKAPLPFQQFENQAARVIE
jgi:hypothetical protein